MALSYADAVRLVKTEAQRHGSLQRERCSIYSACDRVAAERITSPISTPEYDTSAMDGFALSSTATETASPETPVTFEVMAITTAGDRPYPAANGLRDAKDGTPPCVEIMTGAPFPTGQEWERFDCSVPIEEVVVQEDRCPPSQRRYVSVCKPARRWQHRRFAGGDFTQGDRIIEAGDCIQPQHIMAMASVGLWEITVLRRPRIAVFSTGSELLSDGSKAHQFMIHDANGPYLTSILRQWGVDIVFRGVLQDDPAAMEESIVRALDDGYDMIVTSGAVSAGRCDIIPGLVKHIGGRTVFHKVAVKPGHPILFAMFPTPRETGQTAFFGLPGNTVAAAACLRFFALPYLRTLQRQSPEEPQAAALRLYNGEAEPCNGAAGKVLTFREAPDIFRPAVSTQSGQVWIIDDHSPGKTKPFLQANCWAHIPSGVSEMQAGSRVDIYPL
ncbi:MoeA, N-terminal and linker domain-containing protein [Aspergillus tetrazonus]